MSRWTSLFGADPVGLTSHAVSTRRFKEPDSRQVLMIRRDGDNVLFSEGHVAQAANPDSSNRKR
jgi:hypothetical protein